MIPTNRFAPWGGKRSNHRREISTKSNRALYSHLTDIKKADNRRFFSWDATDGSEIASGYKRKAFSPWGGKRLAMPSSRIFAPWGGKRGS